jgi:hypothetical protein
VRAQVNVTTLTLRGSANIYDFAAPTVTSVAGCPTDNP